MKYITPFFAIAGAVAGQSSSACSGGTSGTFNIQNAGDAAALASCTTFSGNILIAPQTAGRISIPGVRRITGDLVMAQAQNVTSLSADALQIIEGKFTLNDNQLLSDLTFPFLAGAGEVSFEGLPNLVRLNFATNLRKTNTLNIQNTWLDSLSGINLQEVRNIYIANNRMLQSISFQVSQLPGALVVMSNGDRLEAAFPNLITAQNVTFRNCLDVSIPSLHNVTGHLGFYESTMETISAVNLTGVGGTIAVNDNTKLNNISFPVLSKILGGFQVQNNTVLDQASFPALELIGGALDFYGIFKNIDLPVIKDIRGAFNIQSTADIKAQCDAFKSVSGPNKVIKGKFRCDANVQSLPNSGSTGGSGDKKKGSAVTISRPSSVVVALICFLAAVVAL